ncbi:zinc-binding dehydrogenase [Natrinema longum]|uniref:zinc-binding dehydrogenase n=1 Tax=Natrinema longum TaxID=370324 RepID=UPI001CCA7CD4|nr:zinc-binding dehydrogenase [Natrinema longum]MBZ6496971.1 zinc-binding dehydrogenase [Natrinema longum]
MSNESAAADEAATTGHLVYLNGPRDLEFREYEVPDPDPHAVVTEVVRSNVCGSELHVWKGDHPLKDCVLGHEALCRISELGENVDTDSAGNPVEEGDLVAPVYFQTCQSCDFCRRGEFYACDNDYEHTGKSPEIWPHFHAPWGTHYYIYPDNQFFKIPEKLENNLNVAAASNCALSQVLFGIEEVEIDYNDTVVIQGAGGLGLNATVVANEYGAETIVIDGVDKRLEQAAAFGADHTIDFRELDTVEARKECVDEITNGVGADVGIEVAGVPEAFMEGIELLRKGGRYLEMGNVRPGHEVDFDPGKLTRKSIDITTAVEYDPWVLYDALQFLANTVDEYPYERLIDAEYPLEDIEEALEASENRDLTRATLIPSQ